MHAIFMANKYFADKKSLKINSRKLSNFNSITFEILNVVHPISKPSKLKFAGNPVMLYISTILNTFEIKKCANDMLQWFSYKTPKKEEEE